MKKNSTIRKTCFTSWWEEHQNPHAKGHIFREVENFCQISQHIQLMVTYCFMLLPIQVSEHPTISFPLIISSLVLWYGEHPIHLCYHTRKTFWGYDSLYFFNISHSSCYPKVLPTVKFWYSFYKYSPLPNAQLRNLEGGSQNTAYFLFPG